MGLVPGRVAAPRADPGYVLYRSEVLPQERESPLDGPGGFHVRSYQDQFSEIRCTVDFSLLEMRTEYTPFA